MPSLRYREHILAKRFYTPGPLLACHDRSRLLLDAKSRPSLY